VYDNIPYAASPASLFALGIWRYRGAQSSVLGAPAGCKRKENENIHTASSYKAKVSQWPYALHPSGRSQIAKKLSVNTFDDE
jgi:hypothetical protein